MRVCSGRTSDSGPGLCSDLDKVSGSLVSCVRGGDLRSDPDPVVPFDLIPWCRTLVPAVLFSDPRSVVCVVMDPGCRFSATAGSFGATRSDSDGNSILRSDNGSGSKSDVMFVISSEMEPASDPHHNFRSEPSPDSSVLVSSGFKHNFWLVSNAGFRSASG